MLSANKEKLQSFFMGQNQFRIPFFQRAYVWQQDNWNELWENIIDELNELQNNNFSEHFIGTIIIKQTETERLGTLVYDLVDGQQRLTTICLVLKALHDKSTDENIKNWIQSLLVFVDSYGVSNLRILHSKVDKDYFQEILLSQTDNEGLVDAQNKVVGCYKFFRKKIESEIDDTKIRQVVNIILERLPVIHMALSKDDDVQQIFDTINSLGVKLTTGELLKNYLFSFKALESYYKPYWHDVFEADEDAILFWDKNKTAGRVNRSTVELFLYSFLVIKKETPIRIESLFKEYKNYLKDMSTDALIDFAEELHEYAKLYQELPEGENLVDIHFNEHEKRFFHLINELEITTVLPLVLFIYKQIPGADRIECLRFLESYLIRRAICKLTTKNYNNIFLSVMVELKRMGNFTSLDFKKKLLAFTEDSNKFPDDVELAEGFETSHLVNKYSKEVLYCIALYDLNHEYQDNRRLNSGGFSVEHIMPKQWKNHWTLASGSEAYRNHRLLTLGNLTLVKGKLNSSMRDSSWSNKKKALSQYSTLKQTVEYIGYNEWDEDKIDVRSEQLYLKALQVWPR